MPRVILAHWHAGRAPGDELDVTDEELADLRRDGRISEVLDGPGAQPEPSSAPEPEDQAAPEPEAPEDEAAAEEPPPSGRKRR
ncbi:hypothetical protein PV396_24395 [Streptomyces sp. ME02-8801-2C]|uniref:hypothetical protein n=1 Tax=Streptomyces sp. ME02-8801-2C TaxID=3028680 RepID=UPI0029B8B1CB|nr:hypothetical protein [Streptomyces sp. ME02-8801-2C]MDX3455042.1 hypothetical protein [Streptomyces sp. ME02-8801-2C]